MPSRLSLFTRSTYLLLAVLFASTWGCGGRSVTGRNDNINTNDLDGSVPDAAPTDGGPQPDAFIDAGGTSFGYVNMVHVVDSRNYGVEYLTLSAKLYVTQFNPPISTWPGFVESRITPNGVMCDILYSSGMEDPPDEPLEPPEALDGGPIWLVDANSSSSPDKLMVEFADGGYTSDHRSAGNPQGSLPEWLNHGPMSFLFEADGNEHLAAFDFTLNTSEIPEITIPGPDGGPIPPDLNGNFHVAWSAPGENETLVVFNFNLDWDNSSFICHPGEGTEDLEIPMDWINDFTWGSGSMVVISQSQETLEEWPHSVVQFTGRRAVETRVQFETMW